MRLVRKALSKRWLEKTRFGRSSGYMIGSIKNTASCFFFVLSAKQLFSQASTMVFADCCSGCLLESEDDVYVKQEAVHHHTPPKVRKQRTMIVPAIERFTPTHESSRSSRENDTVTGDSLSFPLDSVTPWTDWTTPATSVDRAARKLNANLSLYRSQSATTARVDITSRIAEGLDTDLSPRFFSPGVIRVPPLRYRSSGEGDSHPIPRSPAGQSVLESSARSPFVQTSPALRPISPPQLTLDESSELTDLDLSSQIQQESEVS